MKKTYETIVFFGSGPVAARSLELLANVFSIEAVITKPKPLHHKGEFPVIDTANKLNLPILTAVDKASLDKLMATGPVKSNLAILIDFGIIVSQDVINYFKLGIINSHFSLLPKLRGADPITFAILEGLRETGVSLMMLVKEMDEGPLINQAKYNLPTDITTPELTKQLIDLSFDTLVQTVPLYLDGTIKPYPQDVNIKPSYSRKLTKHDGIIDWNKPAIQIEREVRAFIDWPKSRTKLGGYEVIITQSKVVSEKLLPASVMVKDHHLIIGTNNQSIDITKLKPIGKSDMSAREFLAGYRLEGLS